MSAQAATPAAEGARARKLTEWVFRVRELGIIVAFLLLVTVDRRSSSRASSRPPRCATSRSTPRSSRSSPSARRSCSSRATSTSRSARCSA